MSLSENFTSDPSYIPDMFEVKSDATMTIIPIMVTAARAPLPLFPQPKVTSRILGYTAVHSYPDYSYLFIKMMLKVTYSLLQKVYISFF